MSRVSSSFFYPILPWIVLVHTLLFILFWVTNSLFYASSNSFLADMLGRRMDYVSLLLGTTAFIALWSGIRLVLRLLRKSDKLPAVFSWNYAFISLLYIIFFYGSFYLLFSEAPEQPVRLGQLLGYFRIFVDTALFLGLVLLVAFSLRRTMRKATLAGKKQIWPRLLLGFAVIALVWSLPLFFPPEAVLRGELPDKPQVLGHRGASTLAPENTLVAIKRAAQLGTFGIEIDIHVSRDGKLFLLHDANFKRTTDIASVFPGREKEPAENFTWAEISQLNAGRWFVEQDPYGTLRRGLVTPADVTEYNAQSVPLLTDVLSILQESGQRLLFDLFQPPAGHSYRDTYFRLAFDQIHAAGIDPQIWYLVDEGQLALIHNLAPQMVPAYSANFRSPPEASEAVAEGYRIVNVGYAIDRRYIRQYQEAGLLTSLHIVDEPWQFSRLWLLEVDAITSNNAHEMLALEKPVFSLSFGQYLLAWAMVGLVGVGLVIGLIYPLTNRRQVDQASPPLT